MPREAMINPFSRRCLVTDCVRGDWRPKFSILVSGERVFLRERAGQLYTRQEWEAGSAESDFSRDERGRWYHRGELLEGTQPHEYAP